MIYKIVHNKITGNYYVYLTDHPTQIVGSKNPVMNKFMCSAVVKKKGIFTEYTRKEKE